MDDARIDRLMASGFLERIIQQDIDWDAVLDARDASGFDAEWQRCCQQISTLMPEETEAILDLREQVFKQVYRLTEHPELAAYVSDDLGLLAQAWQLQFEDGFLLSLWEAYAAGRFPGVAL